MDLNRKAKVLIIDDEELICWSLKKSFEQQENYTVSCVYSGSEAIDCIARNTYDVVVTDLKLPDVYGVELLERISLMKGDTPLIVMSAYLSDPVMYDGAKYDVFRFVNKPFEISDILNGVRDALQSRLGEKGQA